MKIGPKLDRNWTEWKIVFAWLPVKIWVPSEAMDISVWLQKVLMRKRINFQCTYPGSGVMSNMVDVEYKFINKDVYDGGIIGYD
jgi:hypothetical protein